VAELLSHFWAPLCAVGSHGERGPNAQICVSVFGASIVPERPRLLVVLSNTNYTTGLVAESGTLAITVLSERQPSLLRPLGLHSGRDGDKLAGLAFEVTPEGDPYFLEGVGFLRGAVIRDYDLGDSTAFLCSVQERTELAGGEALSWPAARAELPPQFLEDWAAKSAREQDAARAAMHWH
jgi:flavin reductase (DIM6/NTAB) family NADH-FMN oxidoreductase RutF